MAVKDGRLARNVADEGQPAPRGQARAALPHPRPGRRPRPRLRLPARASKHSSYDTRTNEMYRLVVLFLAYTGVRFGEMAALRVARLDLRRRRAVIAESVTPVQGKGLVWGTPKSHQRREVPIPRFLVDELADHVAGREPDDLVFAGIRNGQPLRVCTFRSAFSAAAGVDRHPGPAPARAAAHRGQPRHRVRRRREGRPADARARLGHDDAGHLRAPVRGPPRRGRRGDGRRPQCTAGERDEAESAAKARSAVANLLPTRPEGLNDEGALPSVSAGQDPFSYLYPRRDSNPRYRLERAAC